MGRRWTFGVRGWCSSSCWAATRPSTTRTSRRSSRRSVAGRSPSTTPSGTPSPTGARPRCLRVCGRLCDSFGLVCPERLEVLWDLCSRDRWRLLFLCMLCCKESVTDLLVTLQPAVAKPCSSRSGQPNPEFQSMDSNLPRISSSWLLMHYLYRSSCRTSFVAPARVMLQLHLRHVKQFHSCQGSHACDAGGSAGGKIS